MSKIAETAVAHGDVAESDVKVQDLLDDEVSKAAKIATEEGEEASDDKEVTLQPHKSSKSESPVKNLEENVESSKTSQSPVKDSTADETDDEKRKGQSSPKVEDESSRGNLESSVDSAKGLQDKDEADLVNQKPDSTESDSIHQKPESTESDSIHQKPECTESEKSTESDDSSRKCNSGPLSNECSGKYHSTLSSEGCSDKCHSVQSTDLGDSDLQKEELKQTIDSENAAVSPAS